MCVAVTHYDRQENTILLDQTGHIRATFIGDDEMFDNYNIRVGHTLILRNVKRKRNERQTDDVRFSGRRFHSESASTSLRQHSSSKYHRHSRSIERNVRCANVDQ